MTSSDILAATMEELAKLEKQWRSYNDRGRPLKITAYWYKPAETESDQSRVVAIRQCSNWDNNERSTVNLEHHQRIQSSCKATGREKAIRARGNPEHGRTAAAHHHYQAPLRKTATGDGQNNASNVVKARRHSTKPQLLQQEDPEPPSQPGQTPDPSGINPKPIFTEVRWDVPRRGGTRNGRTALPHREVKRSDTSVVPGFQPAQRDINTQNAPVTVEALSLSLADRPPRPRSPSSVRSRPKFHSHSRPRARARERLPVLSPVQEEEPSDNHQEDHGRGESKQLDSTANKPDPATRSAEEKVETKAKPTNRYKVHHSQHQEGNHQHEKEREPTMTPVRFNSASAPLKPKQRARRIPSHVHEYQTLTPIPDNRGHPQLHPREEDVKQTRNYLVDHDHNRDQRLVLPTRSGRSQCSPSKPMPKTANLPPFIAPIQRTMGRRRYDPALHPLYYP